jgi:hypothetical protein
MSLLIPKLVYGSTTIEFTYPPAQDEGEQIDAKEKQTTALDGTRWVKIDYWEVRRKITLSFLTDAQIAALRTWYLSHASMGYFFRWYEDKALTSYREYQIEKNSFTPAKVVPVGANSFLWEVSLEFRRVGP